MTPLTVTLDVAQTPWTDLRVGADGTLSRIGLLRNGTVRGRATVAVVVDLPDGTQVIGQTTWALLRTAYAALAASPAVAEEVVDP